MKIILEKIKNLKKRYILGGIALVVLIIVFLSRGNNENITLVNPTFGELKSTVNATGVVTSVTDLNLSFKKSGNIKSVLVKVGDKVRENQIIATLSSGSEFADLTRARASVLSAEAKLKKIIEGASNEEINLAKVSLDTAKKDLENIRNKENTLVSNAYNNLLNSNIEAISDNGSTTNAPTISGTYRSNKEGEILISIYNSQSGILFSTSGLVSSSGQVSTISPQPLGDSGLYIVFSSSANLSGTNWKIAIPNKKASDYLANENAYNQALRARDSAISSAESTVAQREAELLLKQAKARNADVELGEADVLSAKASLASAQSNYEDTLIRAPKGGTITKVDIKAGEVANANQTAIVLQDVSNLYVEALINESNIAGIVLNQPVEISFDALGDLNKFTGLVSHIDPSSETSEGIVNYKIKVSINEKNVNIRPGMNSEIVITTLNKPEVLSIPKAAIIERDGKKYVNLITDEKRNKYEEVEITTGLPGDGNMVEILSGITSSDNIAIVTKK